MGADTKKPPFIKATNPEIKRALCAYFVSGGQTGGESVSLICGSFLGIPTKGVMGKGFRREDGTGKRIASRFGLKESKGDKEASDKENADSSDAMIAFVSRQQASSSSDLWKMLSYFLHGDYNFYPGRYTPSPGEKYRIFQRGQTVRTMGMGGVEEEWISYKPLLIVYGLEEGRLTGPAFDSLSSTTEQFLRDTKPWHLMTTGDTSSAFPLLEDAATELLVSAMGGEGPLREWRRLQS